jgi:hypothetical protein
LHSPLSVFLVVIPQRSGGICCPHSARNHSKGKGQPTSVLIGRQALFKCRQARLAGLMFRGQLKSILDERIGLLATVEETVTRPVWY